MQPRTGRQRDVLNFINEFVERRGFKPSYQIIARHLGIASKSAVAKHISALEEQGILQRRNENGNFALQINPPAGISESIVEVNWLEIPFPDSFTETFEETSIFVPKFLLGVSEPDKIFAFRVRNDAMLDEHIREGDVALIEKRSFARDGACVVAMVEKRILLKKYFRTGANVELHPANKNYLPVSAPADKVSILGVFRGLLRPLG